jgi:phosphate transport system substrate-binding protein
MRGARRFLLLTLAIILTFAWHRSGLAVLLINAAGSTFIYPLQSKWFSVYSNLDHGVQFNYQSIGSGGGIRQLLNQVVDMGASDAPMTDEQLKSAPGKILHFPTVIGADAIAYNLPQAGSELRLTGGVLADIYLGKITKWNDPAIARLNPTLKLPATDLVVCHRSDGSGTTYIFADYLSKVSPQWRAQVGRSTSLRWPVGLGGKGNEGITALIKQTEGAIGYVELTYALGNKLVVAKLLNRDGNWVAPSLESLTAAAAGSVAEMPQDLRMSITDAAGTASYPMASYTYLLVYQRQANLAKGKAIIGFLKWALHDGQRYAPPLFYAPLPPQVVDLEDAQLETIQLPGAYQPPKS